MNCPRIFVLVVLLSAAICPVAYSQISSPAFDPNCYQPRIGVPGEIDTIYGGYAGQELGAGLINIGPSPDNPGRAGRLMFGGLAGDKAISGRGGAYSAVDCGPQFDPHQMLASEFKGFWTGSKMIFGHFRSRKMMDILLMDSLGNTARPKFFWADSIGDYDTSRFTEVFFQRSSLSWVTSSFVPYHAYLSSDTAEDVVFIYPSYLGQNHDSIFVAQFKGGNALYKRGGAITSDDEAFFDTIHYTSNPNYGGLPAGCYSADFRGSGNMDCLAADGSSNLFYYRNEGTFRLSQFAYAMRKDSLLSGIHESRIARMFRFGWGGITMRAFAKSLGDSSFDLLLPLDSNGGSNKDGQIRIFRGGRDFGTRRLTIDSSYTIHDPSCFDSNGVFHYVGWSGLTNCGDMTGTGRSVLGIGGTDESSFAGMTAFYVLGDAIDEKVDMFYSAYILGGLIDTCTIDGDGLQDIAQGDPGYNIDGNLSGDAVGTVRFIHGSKKIPVPSKAVLQSVSRTAALLLERSPDGGSLILQIPTSSSFCEAQLHDILGRVLLSSELPVSSESKAILPIPRLPHGSYFLEVRCNGDLFKSKLIF